MGNYLDGSPLFIREYIKLSDNLWLLLGDIKSNQMITLMLDFVASLLEETRGCLVTCVLSVEQDITCY